MLKRFSAPRLRPLFTALVVASAAFLSACSTTGHGGDLAASSKKSALYHVMLGEMALKRQRMPEAKAAYLTAMDLTGDKRVAEKACRVALGQSDYSSALRASDRWTEIDPNDIKGWRVGMMICAQLERPGAAAVRALQLIRRHPDGLVDGYAEVHKALSVHPKSNEVDATYRALAALDKSAAYPWTLRGLNAARLGDYDAALEYADRALRLDANDSRAKIMKAQVWSELGDVPKAIAYLDAEVARQPNNVDLRLSYAKYLITMERKPAARAQYQRVVELQPANDEALFAAGLLDYEQGELKTAKKYFAALLRYAEVSKNEVQRSVAHFYLGQVAEDQQLYVTAASHFADVTGERKFDAQVGLGRLHFKAEEYEAGHKAFAQLRVEHPLKAEAMFAAEAEALARLGELKRSLDVFSAGLKARPYAVQLLLGRSHVYADMGQPQRALADLRKAHGIAPEHPLVLNALGYALTNYTTEYQQALKYIEKALEASPNDPSFLDSLGWVQVKLGQFDKALKNLARAHEQLPAPEVSAHLGEALWLSGEYHKAEAVWREALYQSQNDNAVVRETMERLRQ